MAKPIRIDELDEKLRASGRIEGLHAVQLRSLIYATGSVGPESAKLLLGLDRACSKKDPAFAQLYVEALTDYFVWQTKPKGYVSKEDARFLIENITADGHVESKTELELLLNIVYWARQCPEELSLLLLEAVRQSVLLSRETPLGGNRPRRCIGAGDVALLRKALHAPAGDGSLLVTRREAELLFTLNEATEADGNDPEWSDFFARAIANHLLNPLDAPIPSREDASRRDRWLDERGGIADFFAAMGKALGDGNVPMRDVWEEIDPSGVATAKKEAEAEAQATRKRLAREQIDADEAAWLAKRILQDGTIDENERALLAFLKKEAQGIDPSLQPLLDRAKL